MKNDIVRLYRAHPSHSDFISGVVENTESGQIDPFHRLDPIQILLMHSVGHEQL